MKFPLIVLALSGLIAGNTMADQRDAANGEYFHDAGLLIGLLDRVRLLEDVCSEAEPQTMDANRQAYAAWLSKNKAIVDEADAQFHIIGTYWAALPPGFARGASMETYKAQIAQAEDQLKAHMLALAPATRASFCAAYPDKVIVPAQDFEKKHAALVASVRRGPPPPDTPSGPTGAAPPGEVVPTRSLDQRMAPPAPPAPSADPIVAASLKEGCQKPQYPDESARNEETGTVKMAILVGANGMWLGAKIIKSSGYRLLDRAAMAAFSKCKYQPAQENGAAVQSWLPMTYVWSLE